MNWDLLNNNFKKSVQVLSNNKIFSTRSLTENANLNFLDTTYSGVLYRQIQHAVVIISEFLFPDKLLAIEIY